MAALSLSPLAPPPAEAAGTPNAPAAGGITGPSWSGRGDRLVIDPVQQVCGLVTRHLQPEMPLPPPALQLGDLRHGRQRRLDVIDGITLGEAMDQENCAQCRRSAWPVALSPLAVEVCRFGQSGAGSSPRLGSGFRRGRFCSTAGE